jgi:hypothetical protein
MTTLERLLERVPDWLARARAPRAPSDSVQGRPLAARVNVLLPGLYAWATTVAVPVTAARAPELTRLIALIALIALVLGPLLVLSRPLAGRVLGIHVFVALSVATWGLLVRSGVPLGAEPMHATFGALGWMLYAFGWGELRGPGQIPEDDPRVLPGAPLVPRHALGRSVGVVFAFGVAGALAFVHLAFRVTRPAHSVMAQAVALVAGLLLVGGAARVALDRGERALPARAERVSFAATWLAMLVIVLGLGALFLMLGR